MKELLHKFLTNPWLAAIAWLFTVFGVPLSIGLFIASRETRSLSYSVLPARIVVFDPGSSEAMKLLIDGKPIEGNVYGVQIKVWNTGTLPIRMEHVLRDVEIGFGGGAKLIECRVPQVTRAETELSPAPITHDKASVLLRWKILERNDGGLVQVLYEGKVTDPVYVSGTIEGQREIREATLQSPGRYLGYSILFIVFTPFQVAMAITLDSRPRRSWKSFTFIVGKIYWLIATVMLVGSIVNFTKWLSIPTPFPF